jgi:exodeoxyribonuclease VIII
MRSLKRAIDGNADEASPAMQFGSQYHTMILEPEVFEDTFCVMPDYSSMPENITGKGERSYRWGTTFCNESKAAFESMAFIENKEVITRADYDRGLAMREAIANNAMASTWVNECQREVTMTGEIDGVLCKGRLDLMGDVIADVKGTVSVEPNAFGRSAANLNIAFQLSMYRELFKQHQGFTPDVWIIAVESAGDFDCVCYPVREPILDEAFKQVRHVLAKYKQALKENEWHGVDGGEPFLELHFPNWAMPEADDILDWSGTNE